MVAIYKKYSRGNNEAPNAGAAYETATIEITLTVDKDACQSTIPEGAKSPQCIGDCTLKLAYTATASTNDTQFQTIGGEYALHVGANSTQLSYTMALPRGVKGDKLSAGIDLGTLPCAGGTFTKDVDVERRPGGEGGRFSGDVANKISVKVVVTNCGVINATVSAKELLPTGAPSLIPLRDITPPAGGGAPPETPYPQK